MDAFDLFKKLGAGAKFNFKRFRSDAERLHLMRPKRDEKQSIGAENAIVKTDCSISTYKDSEAVARKRDGAPSGSDRDQSSGDSDSDQASSDSDSEASDDSDAESHQSSSDSESSQSSSDTDSNSKEAFSDVEKETELRLLGDMTAANDDEENTKASLRKKRKKQRKKKSSEEKLAELKQEQINRVRNMHHVHTHGTDIPDPVETFDQLAAQYKIHPCIIKNITSVGYTTPTPIQIQAIPVMLHHREIMACAPTGSGKTAAFIVPILHHLREPRNEGIRALILAPTRELAKQTYREFQRLSEGINFKIMYIDKIGKDPKRLIQITKKIDILVSTPNRLVYMLRQEPPLVSLTSVQWLIVDESDKLFEEGKTGFRDQLGSIYKACDGLNVRRGMFSATFTHDVEEWCKLNLDNVIQVYIGARNSATQTIEQSLLFCGVETGKLLAMRDIIRKGIQPPVLVFVQSKDRAKDLFHELLYDGLNVDVIHAERTQLQRDNVVKSFRAGKIWILICTELMGRGIDFKGVNLVINYDFPNSSISYIHRIGRTGRAGRPGKAITFFTEDDSVYLRSIANVMKAAGCPVPDYMLKINKPDRNKQRQLAKGSINRQRISTVTNYDIQKAKKKRLMVDEGKKKKLREQGLLPPSVPSQGKGDKSSKTKRKSTDGGKENFGAKRQKLSTEQYKSSEQSGSSKPIKKNSVKHKDFKPNFQNKTKGKSNYMRHGQGHSGGRKGKETGGKSKKTRNKPSKQS